MDKLPVGIYKDSLNLAIYNFKSNLVNLISAKNIEVATEYVTHLYEELKLLEDIDVTVFDAEGIVQTASKNIKLDYQNYSLRIQTI